MGQIIYSPGDKVVIKSIDWYNENKDKNGYVRCSAEIFMPSMSKFCGQEMTICGESYYANSDAYYLKEDMELWTWTPDMFE